MTTKQKGGLLKRKKQTAEDKAFTPEKVQQRVKEYEAVKNKPAKPVVKPTETPATKPTEKYDENDGVSFDKAFAKSSKAGAGLFKWKGGMYSTKKK
jgi:hypothetical protein